MTGAPGPQVGCVVVVGAGIRIPGHLTLESFDALCRCDEIYTILTPELAALLPTQLAPKIRSLWGHYQPGALRREAYDHEIQAIITAAAAGRRVAYLTVGNPVLFDSVTHGLLAEGAQRGVEVEVLSAPSAIDAIYTDLRQDIAPGCQVYDASSLVAYGIQLRADIPCLLLQPDLFGTSYVAIGHRPKPHAMRPLKDFLLQFYPPDHVVTYVTSGVTARDRSRLVEFPLAELGGSDDAPQTPGASLFIPAARDVTPDQEFVARMAEPRSFSEAYQRTTPLARQVTFAPVPEHAPDVVVLLSGGPDSAVLLQQMIKTEGSRIIALHLSGIGSPHETSAARRIAAEAAVYIHVIEMSSFFEACQAAGPDSERAGRRAILGAATVYSAALAFAVARQIPVVAIGLNRQDSEAWIEQSPEFIDHMRDELRMVGSDCRILVPFHSWTKAEMFRKGAELGVDLSETWSCIRPVGQRQDGLCSACRDRKTAFQLAGLPDSTAYAGPVLEDHAVEDNGARR
jgi:7-cyano-7-deazaguanine synthase in queuosine biosynthesis